MDLPTPTGGASEAQRITEVLLRCLPGLVYRCRNDARWTMEYISEGCEGLTGYPPEALYLNRDISWQELIIPEDRGRVRSEIDTAMKLNQPFQVEYRIRTAAGETRWVYEQGCAADQPEGHLVGFVTVHSARRVADQQKRRSQRLEALGRLAAGVAHDFNNLLTVILSYAELALGDLDEDDPARAELGHVRDAAERGSLLTRQLLTYTRGAPIAPAPVDLSELVRGLKPMLRRIVPEDTNLIMELAAGLRPVVVDAGSVEQVIVNLTVNARDAMPEGGDVILATELVVLEPRNRLGLAPGPYVQLSVTDRGEGIPEELRDRVFEPFFTTKPSGQGTGLGLSTVRDIVREAGGEARVEDAREGGARFAVYLPVADAEVQVPAPPAASTGEALEGTETILVAEDDQALRRLLSTILSEHGYHVMQARDGVDALRIWTVHSENIDLLVTDVVMPRLGGPALLATLQTQKPRLRHLFVSGYSSSDHLDGPIIHKPFTPERLLCAVRQALDAES